MCGPLEARLSKRWTGSEARTGRSVSPKLVNDELRAQQSSATTLDRTQVPGAWVDESYVAANAMVQVWHSTSNIEQTNEVDSSVNQNCFLSSTIQTAGGGWRTLESAQLSGFKGGSLFVEWSANCYVNNIFCYGSNDGKPGTPNYLSMRILVNGVPLAARRGAGYHQTCRIFGSQLFPPGDLTVDLQWRDTAQSQDAADQTTAGDHVPYSHVYNSRWLAIARLR